ncbi:MAG: class I SAM-dependent methyltransferase [Candidatus Schekmanbacteria bacterium]|nr:class I SAM-dependent methyltransferase [Candidatus Schekmanbacteria bacterium]
MKNDSFHALSEYALELVRGAEPPLLAALAEETRRATSRPGMMIGPVEGALLRLLVQLAPARRVLEIGTFTGYSALWMASGLPPDGRVVSCDVSEEWTSIARRYWEQSPDGGKIELRLGPAAATLAALVGPFDLAFIDADKESYPAYWERCLELVRPGGLIVLDNALWGGTVLAPDDEASRTLAALNRRIAADSRVAAVLLTVRDGMMVTRKR